jgi:hypothetical protein
MVYNSGNFKKTVTYLFRDGKVFDGFLAFSRWIYNQTQSTWQISLDRLAYLIYNYLTQELHVEEQIAKENLKEDILRVEGRKLPKFLRMEIKNKKTRKEETKTFNKRQLKHNVV